MRTLRKQGVRRWLVGGLTVLLLLPSMGCSYFKVHTFYGSEIDRAEVLNPKRIYYVHLGDEVMFARQVLAEGETVKLFLSDQAALPPLYEEGQRKRIKGNEGNRIIEETHFYLRPNVGELRAGEFEVLSSQIEEIHVIKRDVPKNLLVVGGSLLGVWVIFGVIYILADPTLGEINL